MILYVSYRFEKDIGSVVHLNILKELYGSDNVFVVDLRMDEPKSAKNYRAFGKYKNKLARIFQWVQGNTMYISNNTIREICKIVDDNNIELVFIEDSVFGNLAKAIKKHFSQIPIIAFYHDIVADLFRQKSRQSKSLLTKIECAVAIKQEKLQQKYNDINIVFNDRDTKLYKKYYSQEPDIAIPLAAYVPKLENNYMNSENKSNDIKHLLFVGAKYWPNIVGIRWFYKNVLPSLSDNIVVNIVGRGTEFLAEEFTDSRVKVYGTVDDVFEFLKNADIFIAPIFDGGGMKTKTVEAISYGKCIVSTDEGLVGFWDEMDDFVRGNSVYLCNTAQEWIDTLNKLADSDISKFNPALFEIFKNKFSYEANREAFSKILF